MTIDMCLVPVIVMVNVKVILYRKEIENIFSNTEIAKFFYSDA